MERVLIVPWGNPFDWGEIKYTYENYENNKEFLCTLPILKEKIKPNKIIIIVADTLANFVKEKNKNIIEPPIEQREFSDYNEVLKDVKERIEYFIKNKIKEKLNEIELIIAPGVGVFRNTEVYGELLDYYYFVTYKLAELLPVTDMEVYLDLTHGINYMPVLTYRAVLNLLGLASYLRNVEFTALNSEPYPRGIARDKLKDVRLNIKTVEKRKLQPKPILSLLSETFDSRNAFISSVANGFPLVFATFYPDHVEIKREIDNKLNTFSNNIEVNGKILKRNSKLNSDFKTLSKLYYLLRVLNTNNTFRDLPKRELPLEELKTISNILFKNLPRVGIIVEEQLRYIEDRLTKKGKPKSYIENSWKPLKKYIMTEGTSGSDNASTERAVRNFIAHSGFEYNITLVQRFFDTIQFKYKSKDSVIEYAVKSLILGDHNENYN